MKQKAGILSGLSWVLMLFTFIPVQARDMSVTFPDVVSSNSVWVTFTPLGEIPEWMAVIVRNKNPEEDAETRFNRRQNAITQWQSELKTNRNAKMPFMSLVDEIDFDHAMWLPFKTNLLVDLGPGDGQRELETSFRYKGQTKSDGWSGGGVEVRSTLPTIAISSPPEGITSQPVVQLKGYTSHQPMNLKYKRANEAGQIAGSGEGLVNDKYYDMAKGDFTTNYFTCYDVALDPGTNTFVVSADDLAGNHFSSKYVLVFSTVGDTNPPVFKIDWPTDGMAISGSHFDINGSCDDPTARVTALACNDEGKTTQDVAPGNYVPIYVTDVPIADGKNYITVVATDAAGNSSLTNLTLTKSTITLTIDPVPPADIGRFGMKVTGFCSDTNYMVFASGTKAYMNPDGHWVAYGVRIENFIYVTTEPEGDITPQTNTWLPTVGGRPVDNSSLQAGLSLKKASTNEFNHYRVDLGFTNTSGQSLPNLTWMLPKEDARYVMHLFDRTNNEIAKHEWRGNSGQPLATNLNIHHLGKNEVEQIGGILPFPTNATARIATLNLDEHYQLPPPGDYRFEVTERLYKIAPNGQLIPFTFPSLSTMIKIIDQPSEMVFYLNNLQREGKLSWGAERYGLRIGVAHGFKWTRIEDANQIAIFLQNTSTNDYRNWDLRFPNPTEQFDVTLYDVGGNEVPKTTLGKQQGQPLSLDGQNPRKATGLMDEFFAGSSPRRGRQLRPVFVSAKDATDCARFNLNDYFEIKTPGKYRLSYQQRFYRWNTTNSILTGVTMPLVIMPLDVTYIPGK